MSQNKAMKDWLDKIVVGDDFDSKDYLLDDAVKYSTDLKSLYEQYNACDNEDCQIDIINKAFAILDQLYFIRWSWQKEGALDYGV